jgi:hypothetical protein
LEVLSGKEQTVDEVLASSIENPVEAIQGPLERIVPAIVGL